MLCLSIEINYVKVLVGTPARGHALSSVDEAQRGARCVQCDLLVEYDAAMNTSVKRRWARPRYELPVYGFLGNVVR